MKKHLLFALGIACAATCLTACHDNDGDEDGDGNVASDFATVSVMQMPTMFSNFTNNLGATAYMLSDGNINLFTYVTGTAEENPIANAFQSGTVESTADGEEGTEDEYVDVEKTSLYDSDLPKIYEAWYGGFMPTWKVDEANDDLGAYDIVTPIDGTYANKKNCLVANPGLICKALFTKNISSVMANVTMKKALKLKVQAPKIYNDLKAAAEGDEKAKSSIVDGWGMTLLPANTKIEVIVYSYVESFKMSNIKTALNTIKTAGSQAAKGGKEIGRATLIETDANGKVTTICNSWNEIKFSSQTYLGEVYIKASTSGKDVTDEMLGTEGTHSMLNYVLVDDITFEGRSLLNLF